MSANEEERIHRLLASVEREERDVERPTGAFVRNLFESDSDENEEPDDEPDEPEIEAEEVAIVNDLQNNLGDEDLDVCEDDFSDLEQLPLAVRLNSSIVSRQNNKLAYLSKDRTMLWDVDPPPQGRTRQRNITLMRMGCQSICKDRKKSFRHLEIIFYE